MENLIEDISEAKGVLIGEIVLVIAWFYYLGHLDKLNEKLKEYYSSSDGAVVRAFKIVFFGTKFVYYGVSVRRTSIISFAYWCCCGFIQTRKHFGSFNYWYFEFNIDVICV